MNYSGNRIIYKYIKRYERVRNLKVFDPFLIAHFIDSQAAQLIRSEMF